MFSFRGLEEAEFESALEPGGCLKTMECSDLQRFLDKTLTLAIVSIRMKLHSMSTIIINC